MAQAPLNEISRFKIPIGKGDVPSLSWEDSPLTVVSEKTVSIFKLSHNLHCMDKKIDSLLTDIPCPKTSPATSLFSNEFLKKKITNLEYNQMMMDPTLWPHSVLLLNEMASVSSVQWSPTNIMQNHKRVIAILNNVGNIELFSQTRCGYSSVLNISDIIERNHKDYLVKNMPQNMQEAKNFADSLETSAFGWGSQCNDAFNFVTAQKNGDILLWQITHGKKGLQIKELLMQHSEAGEIITLKWITISDDMFLLLLGNIMGQLYVYKYQWEGNHTKLINCDCPWPHKDRMVIRHLKYRIVDNKLILLCNKNRHLLILMLDDSCNKISEYLNNLNDHKIAVISESDNVFYVGTINCKIYIVNIIVVDNQLNIHLEEKTFKENLANHDLCGLVFSKNNVICALSVVPRKILVRKENICMDIIFLSQEESHHREMALLLANPTKKLTHYWDCIELVRCKCLKLKVLPDIDFNLLYSTDNIYNIKLYRMLLICYQTLDNLLKNKSKGWLPEVSLEVVSERILLLHARNLMANIYNKIQKKAILADIESESLVCAQKYIQYYCRKYKTDITEFVPTGSYNTKADLEYVCQCCDEVLEGFSCNNGHLNMFCSLTLTMIESDDYLSCDSCGLIARKELLPQNPVCLFCDLYLNTYS